MAEVEPNQLHAIPTPTVGKESVVPDPDHMALSWSHLRQETPKGIIPGTDELAVAAAKKHFAKIAAASVDHLHQRTTVYELEALRKAPVLATEDDGTCALVKFGRRGEVIRSEEETFEETSGAA